MFTQVLAYLGIAALAGTMIAAVGLWCWLAVRDWLADIAHSAEARERATRLRIGPRSVQA